MSLYMPEQLQICRRWIEQLRDRDHTIWLGTFQFKSLDSGEAVTAAIMQHAVERFYARLVNKINENRSKVHKDGLPILIGCPILTALTEQPNTTVDETPPSQSRLYRFVLAEAQRYGASGMSLEDYIDRDFELGLINGGYLAAFELRLCRSGNDISPNDIFDNLDRTIVTTADLLILPKPTPPTASSRIVDADADNPDDADDLVDAEIPDDAYTPIYARQLRDGFRRLVDEVEDFGLANGFVFDVFHSKTDPIPFLTILPECDLNKESEGYVVSVVSDFRMKSATLIVPAAGVAQTLTGTAQRVLHDLTGVFEELVIRDPEFQHTNDFLAIVRALAALPNHSYALRRTSSLPWYWYDRKSNDIWWAIGDDARHSRMRHKSVPGMTPV